MVYNVMGHHAAYVTAWQEAQGAFKINVKVLLGFKFKSVEKSCVQNWPRLWTWSCVRGPSVLKTQETEVGADLEP